MSNRFFTFHNQFISGSVAKSSEVNTQFQAIETAFDANALEMNRAIKMPAAESAVDQVLTPTAANRHGYLLGFDLTGAVAVSNKFLINWDMDSKRLRNLPLALASDEPVTLGQLGAWTGNLVGLPSIVAQNGLLVTDGASVSWEARGSTLLPTAPTSDGLGVIYSSGAWRTSFPGQNLILDPSGAMGADSWATSLVRYVNEDGPHFGTAGFTTQTFDHAVVASGVAPVSVGSALTFSAYIDAAGVSAGTVKMLIRFYDSGMSTVGDSTPLTITNGTASRRYGHTATAPAGTSYAKVVVQFAGATASSGGVKIKQPKLERGSYATQWSDDRSVAYPLEQRTQSYLGKGFTTPILTIGDATATTASVNFRSNSGSQAYDVRLRSSSGTNGTPGKGTLSVECGGLSVTGMIGYNEEYNAGNSGASKTIDFRNGSKQKLALTAATPAITISSSGLLVGTYQLKVIQDPSVARVPTWVGFAAGDCAGNVLPTVTTTLSGVCFIYLYWDGAAFFVTYSNWD